MIRYIIWAIVLYCLIRFIFNFVIPLFRATSRMKQQVRDFQEKMNQGQQQSAPGYTPGQHSEKPKSGDYIDFEEVR